LLSTRATVLLELPEFRPSFHAQNRPLSAIIDMDIH
jgi:hypothetical protein